MNVDFNKIRTRNSLVSAIIFFVIGALLFTNPNKFIAIVSYSIGAILILIGIYKIIKNYYNTKQDSSTPATDLTVGIVLVIAGILFLMLANTIGVALQYVCGGWMLFSGINKIINSFQMNRKDNNFVVSLIISALIIAAGLYTILKSNLAFEIVGIIMMVYSVLEIIEFISNKNGTQKDVIVKEEVTTIVPIEEKIQEAKIIEDKTDDKKSVKDNKKDNKKKKSNSK